MIENKNGQRLLDRLVGYIGRYVHFDPIVSDQPLVCAVWAIHTWLSERFYSTPYLSVTAPTKGAGKTLLLEVLQPICRRARVFATVRPLAVVRLIEQYNGELTVMFDEGEQLGKSTVGDCRGILAAGYRKGGVHPVTEGKRVTEYPCYCPKATTTIGDLTDVLRDRAIVVRLEKGRPAGSFLGERMEAEATAAELAGEIQAVFGIGRKETVAVPFRQPEALPEGSRDREIWSVLWSILLALDVDADTRSRFSRAMGRLCAAKKAPQRQFYDLAAEQKADDTDYAERVLRDLVSVLPTADAKHTGDIHAEVAVERLNALDTAPWSLFRGVGLDEVMLSKLLARYGVTASGAGRRDGCPVVRMQRGRAGRQARGYRGDQLREALKRSSGDADVRPTEG